MTAPSQHPQPEYYVHDWNDGFQYFKTEKEAKDRFAKILEDYKQEAVADEWQDEVEHLSWGIICQTVKLKKVMGDIYESKIIDHTPARNDSDVLDSLVARIKHHIGFFDNAYALANTLYEKSEAIGTVAGFKLVLQDYEQLRQQHKEGEQRCRFDPTEKRKQNYRCRLL